MRNTLLFCLGILCSISTEAQTPSFEIGILAGVSNYMGDLQQTHFELKTVHPARGAFFRFNLNDCLSLRGHYLKGKISGADANYPHLLTSQRNLSFESDLYETGLQLEAALMHFGKNGRRSVAPYLFGGVANFSFNPTTEFNGSRYELQPLQTEGVSYELQQISFPVGVGFNAKIGQRVVIGYELGWRLTRTDYLDDVSGNYLPATTVAPPPMTTMLANRSGEVTEGSPLSVGYRGDSGKLDKYFFGMVSLSVQFGKRSTNEPLH